MAENRLSLVLVAQLLVSIVCFTLTDSQSCDEIGCFNSGICGFNGHCICQQQYSGQFCETGTIGIQEDEIDINLPTTSTSNVTLNWTIYALTNIAYRLTLPDYTPECPSITITEPGGNKAVYYSGCGNGSTVDTDASMILITYKYDQPVQHGKISVSKIDTCYQHDCLNGGICGTTDGLRFTCSCQPGYEGRYCNVDVFCDPNPCQNGGNCSHGTTGPLCSCKERVTGALCETGFCEDAVGATNGTLDYYESPGYPNSPFKDVTCNVSIHADSDAVVRLYIDDVRLDDAESQSRGYLDVYDVDGPDGTLLMRITASNNGSYNSSVVSSRSTMAVYFESFGLGEGFKIHYSQEYPDYCKDFVCLNGGTCSPNSHQAFCHCVIGYFGQNCQNYTTDLCSGISEPCLNGGTCIPINATYFKCQCPDHFYGAQCQNSKQTTHISLIT